MTFDPQGLFLVTVAYLLLLFLIAYAAERGWIPARVTRHPATYVLSLGVYATSWTYYGSVGFAQAQGYNFLAIYLGVTVAFLLAPALLMPILRLVRDYQLTSLADLFAFRFRSQAAGMLVTLFMLAGTLPYIALQIRAVTESLQILTQEATPQAVALVYCVTLTLFAILFGARHISPREKHEGLVVAIAFESLIKLIALVGVGLFAVFGIFGGLGDMQAWIAEHPEATQALYEPVREGPWTTLLVLAFAAAFLLPRQFHMMFTENKRARSLLTASWAFPLFLLVLNLPIPIILWAGTAVSAGTDPDYYVLGITLSGSSSLLPVFAFIGGVSAASAMMIVTTLALAAMCLNHLLLPASYPDPYVDLYRWLLWGRRMLIAFIIMLGYGFYQLLEHNEGLVELGLVSFVAVAQFLPGIAGVLYWRRATRHGFVIGLIGGIAVWTATLLVPLLQSSGVVNLPLDPLPSLQQGSGLEKWGFAAFWSLAVNSLLFIAVSLLTRQNAEELEAARACCTTTFTPPGGVVAAASPPQFKERLSRVLGEDTAEREVRRAMEDLELGPDEHRPGELRRLREQIERNLSGLIGPPLARMIVNEGLELDADGQTAALSYTFRAMEDRLEASRSELRGLAAELDALRRYHRQVLQDLPLAVCAISAEKEIVIWNLAMELLSGISRTEALGRKVDAIREPWGSLLAAFADADDQHIYRREISIEGYPRWFNLHKATIGDPIITSRTESAAPGIVMLFEDLTDLETLEAELAHSERLASIGRLAAGVAHEIGNPVTGIACLAQNLRAEDDSSLVHHSASQILQQTNRINDIVQSLMAFSRGNTPENSDEHVNLHDTVVEAIRLVRLSRSGREVECLNTCPRDVELKGDRQRFLQVLVNLLTNACDASDPGDRVEVHASREDGHIQIEVRDRGRGIPEDLKERVFEPFFTTKRPGEGTGLGLPIVYKIIEDHGGSIELDSVTGTGTRAVVRLPFDESPRDHERAIP
ncbi:MAG: ATP-binding protein [Acidiferrobacterales bacterium]